MKKIFGNNLGTMLAYLVISFAAIGLSCLALLNNNEFNYYPTVITTISFAFGAIYLFASLKSMTKKVEMSENKNYNVMVMMGSNFLRFAILMVSVACTFIFIYFGPRTGDIPKWVYILLLITGVPMFVNIGLFYMRGKFVE